MLTKTLSDYLKANLVLQGVWDTIVKESPMINRLDFKEIKNDIIQYNMELTMPTLTWTQPGDPINENTGTFEQRTTNMYTIIGDADTDKSMIAMNPQSANEATDIAAKSKAMAHAFEKAFVMGRTTSTSSTREFKGLLLTLAEMESSSTTDLDGASGTNDGRQNSQVIPVNATSGALTMPYMDELIDQVRPGKPDMLLMSRRSRRKLNALLRASGTSGIELMELKEFGMFVPSYDGNPVFISDWVPDNLPDASSSVLTISTYVQTTTRASANDNTIIFAMKLSEDDLTGLQAGSIQHERETFIEGKNVIRNRFSWNVAIQCKKKYSLAGLININPDS